MAMNPGGLDADELALKSDEFLGLHDVFSGCENELYPNLQLIEDITGFDLPNFINGDATMILADNEMDDLLEVTPPLPTNSNAAIIPAEDTTAIEPREDSHEVTAPLLTNWNSDSFLQQAEKQQQLMPTRPAVVQQQVPTQNAATVLVQPMGISPLQLFQTGGNTQQVVLQIPQNMMQQMVLVQAPFINNSEPQQVITAGSSVTTVANSWAGRQAQHLGVILPTLVPAGILLDGGQKMPINRINVTRKEVTEGKVVKRSKHKASQKKHQMTLNDLMKKLKNMVIGEEHNNISKPEILRKAIGYIHSLKKKQDEVTAMRKIAGQPLNATDIKNQSPEMSPRQIAGLAYMLDERLKFYLRIHSEVKLFMDFELLLGENNMAICQLRTCLDDLRQCSNINVQLVYFSTNRRSHYYYYPSSNLNSFAIPINNSNKKF